MKKSPVDPDTASYKPSTEEEGDQALNRMGWLGVLKATTYGVNFPIHAMLTNMFKTVSKEGEGHLLIPSLCSSYSAQHPNQVLQYPQSV